MALFGKKGNTTELTVTGMTCGHCEMRVKMALEKVPGVKKAKADNVKDVAIITHEGELDMDAAVQAVKDAGYEAHPPI
ncbi:MAG: cation transporter [Thermoplasmata archaeon]|nr:MAG: cation transporter [Thermoplasmata archaeon]